MNRLLAFILLSEISAKAQTITETFGAGVNAFSIEFVQIGNLGNAADTTGSPNSAGSVSYAYHIGKYEISQDVINKANLYNDLNISLFDLSPFGGNGPNRPATGISWYEAARFVNYLNTSQGFSNAYKFDASGNYQIWNPSDNGYNASNRFRNTSAKYYLPSLDEWYKAAYGSPSGNWYNFPNGSDVSPSSINGGTEPNSAVFSRNYWEGPADYNNAGGLSAWGTMAQGGNICEWMETAIDLQNDVSDETRERRGGLWYISNSYLDAGTRFSGSPSDEHGDSGFRVAMVPEPSALSLLAVGLGGLALLRQGRKKD